MLTILYAILMIGIIAAPIPILLLIDKKQKLKERNQLLLQFHLAGEAHALTLSSQDILKDIIIGVDGVHRKMLMVERTGDDSFRTNVVDLNEMRNCSVRMQYGTIIRSDADSAKPDHYLEKIYLHLDLIGKPPVQILFYQRNENLDNKISSLKTKANQWATVLSKMETH